MKFIRLLGAAHVEFGWRSGRRQWPMMRPVFASSVLALALIFAQPAKISAQQEKESKPSEAKSAETKPPEAKEPEPKEESSVTDHTIRLGGQMLPYKATASTTLLKNDKGEPTALIFSTAYTRSDVKDVSTRPLAFIYNGGPGSASVWLHMGAFGPRRIVTTNAPRSTPPPPYEVEDNIDCLLDKTDMVFIDPVGTGYSHAVGKTQNKDFWGVDEDVKSLAQFILTYVTRNRRWNSPKFLIGESYGTFRSAALCNYLQFTNHMDFTGIVMVSSVLDVGTLAFSTGTEMPYVFFLPSYAAAAWVNNMLKDRPGNLEAVLDQARQFAATEYLAVLMKGSKLTDADKAEMARKLSRFTGLSEDYLIKANLRVSLPQFNAELERSKGLTTGRYDARFTGPTYDLLTEQAEYDPSYTAVAGAFTAAINSYLREDLKFVSDRTYEILSFEPSRNWNWKHTIPEGGGSLFPGSPNVEEDLVEAMIRNPHLQVQVENGFFDMATPFFGTEWTMDHLLLPANLRSHIHLDYYTAGHMMYLNDADHDKLAANVRAFIASASK